MVRGLFREKKKKEEIKGAKVHEFPASYCFGVFKRKGKRKKKEKKKTNSRKVVHSMVVLSVKMS